MGLLAGLYLVAMAVESWYANGFTVGVETVSASGDRGAWIAAAVRLPLTHTPFPFTTKEGDARSSRRSTGSSTRRRWCCYGWPVTHPEQDYVLPFLFVVLKALRLLGCPAVEKGPCRGECDKRSPEAEPSRAVAMTAAGSPRAHGPMKEVAFQKGGPSN